MRTASRIGFAFAVVAIVADSSIALAQSTNLIEEQLDGVRNGFFQLGPFYATPVLRITSGYDSNALSTPDPESDIVASFGPGIRLGLPMGSSAFLDLYQEIDYVYYREQVDLRRVFNVSRVGGGWGGRRFLLRLDDEFRDETMRPTSEFDFPVRMRTNWLGASVSMLIGWRQTLGINYRQLRSEILDDPLDDPTLAERLNNVRDNVSLELRRNVTAKTQMLFEGFFRDERFDDATRDNTSYGARAGFDFSPDPSGGLLPSAGEPGISGTLLVGFRKLVPVETDRVAYTGLIGDADVSVTSRSGHRLRGLFGRDVVPSIFAENWYFVESRLGAYFRWQLYERFSIEPGVIAGVNDYPLPRRIENQDGEMVDEEIVDEHLSVLMTVEYNFLKSWFVGVTARYIDRQSNIVSFDKDRLVVGLNLTLRP